MGTSDRVEILRTLAEALVRDPGASMEQLAQALGVSRATLHRHVSSRDELEREITEVAMSACRTAFSSVRLEDGPADDALVRLVSSLTPNSSFFMFLHIHARADACKLEQEWEEDRGRLVSFFQRGQEEGVFRIDMPATWLVDALGGLMHASAEAAHAGRLASGDMNRMVCVTLLDGARRRPASGHTG